MTVIYKTKWGSIAYGGAPKGHQDIDKIHVKYQANIILDLTETSERTKYHNYRPHISREIRDRIDVAIKHFPIPNEGSLRKQDDLWKKFGTLVIELAELHKKKRKIFIHDFAGHNRAPLLFGCIVAYLNRTMTFEEIMNIVEKSHVRFADNKDLFNRDICKTVLEMYCKAINHVSLSSHDKKLFSYIDGSCKKNKRVILQR